MEYDTDILTLINNQGKTIVLAYDHTQDDTDRPLILIPCQYEKNFRDNMVISIYLVGNGFNVLRYDHTNHVGLSDGDHVDHTASGVYNDFGAVMKFLREKKGTLFKRLGLLGISLTSRILFRYLAESDASDFDVFISLVGVVHVDDTLKNITGEDIVKGNRDGKHYGIRKILKYPIDWDNYLTDINKNNYNGLECTKQDIRKISVPMIVICAEKDDWVNINEYYEIFSENLPFIRGKYFLPNAAHKLNKNPEAAEQALVQIVKSFSRYMCGTGVTEDTMYKPIVTEIIARNKIERQIEMKLTDESLVKGNA